MKKNQENVFIEGQSDAWFDRNFKNGIKALPEEHRIIRLVKSLDLPSSGNLIDVGGAAGSVAAGIIKVCPGWKATVLEPSQKAVKAGSDKAFSGEIELIVPDSEPLESIQQSFSAGDFVVTEEGMARAVRAIEDVYRAENKHTGGGTGSTGSTGSSC